MSCEVVNKVMGHRWFPKHTCTCIDLDGTYTCAAIHVYVYCGWGNWCCLQRKNNSANNGYTDHKRLFCLPDSTLHLAGTEWLA